MYVLKYYSAFLVAIPTTTMLASNTQTACSSLQITECKIKLHFSCCIREHVSRCLPPWISGFINSHGKGNGICVNKSLLRWTTAARHYSCIVGTIRLPTDFHKVLGACEKLIHKRRVRIEVAEAAGWCPELQPIVQVTPPNATWEHLSQDPSRLINSRIFQTPHRKFATPCL